MDPKGEVPAHLKHRDSSTKSGRRGGRGRKPARTCNAQLLSVREVVVVAPACLRNPADQRDTRFGVWRLGTYGAGAWCLGAGASEHNSHASRQSTCSVQADSTHAASTQRRGAVGGQANTVPASSTLPPPCCGPVPPATPHSSSLVWQVQAQHAPRLIAPAAGHVAHCVAAAAQQQHGHVELGQELDAGRVALQRGGGRGGGEGGSSSVSVSLLVG